MYFLQDKKNTILFSHIWATYILYLLVILVNTEYMAHQPLITTLSPKQSDQFA
jgi:hypothetical protein